MKKIVSLLAVAMMATVFAAGCGDKWSKCTDAKSPSECKDTKKFEDGKHKELGCHWVGKDGTDTDKDGKCEPKAEAAEDATPTEADKKICSNLSGTTDKECDDAYNALSASGKLRKAVAESGKKCKAGAGGKCELK